MRRVSFEGTNAERTVAHGHSGRRGRSRACVGKRHRYRGFLVQSDDPALPRQFLVRGAPDVERFLLGTGASHLSREVIEAVEAAITPA